MNPDMDSQTLTAACGIMQAQADKLGRHLERLDRPEEIETIHQARVTCRRMRQVFAFFDDCFDPEQMAVWKKATKKLLRRLSLARDLDVHSAFLQTFIDTLDADNKKVRPGLERLLLRIGQQRRQAQDDVVKAADRFGKKKILINIHLQTEKILFQLRQSQPSTQDALRQRIQERLESAFEQMKEKESLLNDPQDVAGHHDLRIAVKRFRYRLEIADALMDGRLDSFVQTAKALQSQLGDLHDCVVWQEELDDFTEIEKERMKEFCGHARSFGRLKPGIDFLIGDRKQAAEELYQQACKSVAEIHRRKPWQDVFEIISHQPLGDANESAD
jgi:CHAD domain-containing protein